MRMLATLLAICAHVGAALASAGSDELLEQSLVIGGIAIGDDETSVTAALGKPNQRTEAPDHFLPITLSYPGLVISLDEQGVGGILSTSKEFCTPANVCPGMTYAQVRETYGPSEPYERGGHIFRDYLWNDGCWLRIEFEAEVATSIDATCSP